LKRATTITKMKVAKVRTGLKTFGTAGIKLGLDYLDIG